VRAVGGLLLAPLVFAACLPLQSSPPLAGDVPSQSPTPMTTSTPVPNLAIGVAPSAPTREVGMGRQPPETCVDEPTPDYGPTALPTHAPVNGQPSLSEPHRRGVILVKIVQCRDIAQILTKYGLLGPATRWVPSAGSSEHIARWYQIGVTVGSESTTVVNLFQHPEDIEYVQLLPEFAGGAAGG
jgi:hypothetical protein